MEHRPPLPVAPPLQRPYEPPAPLGPPQGMPDPFAPFNGLTSAAVSVLPVPPVILSMPAPLGQAPKRPAPEAAQKKKRVRRQWDECANCDSKHGMRYGRVENRQIRYLGCDRCKDEYHREHGVKLKDLTRVCECGSGKDRRYGPKGGQALACVECKDQKVSPDGQPLINLRPSTGQCDKCASGKVKRFGFPPSTEPSTTKAPSARTHCIDCKQDGMVNLSLSKKPEGSWGGKCGCGSGKVRRFGVKGGPRVACINCKNDTMINLTTKICTCGSDRQVRFGFSGGKPEKCSQCKGEGMVDLTKKKDLTDEEVGLGGARLRLITLHKGGELRAPRL